MKSLDQYVQKLAQSDGVTWYTSAKGAEIEYQYLKRHPDTLNVRMHIIHEEVKKNITLALLSTSPFIRRWAELVYEESNVC